MWERLTVSVLFFLEMTEQSLVSEEIGGPRRLNRSWDLELGVASRSTSTCQRDIGFELASIDNTKWKDPPAHPYDGRWRSRYGSVDMVPSLGVEADI